MTTMLKIQFLLFLSFIFATAIQAQGAAYQVRRDSANNYLLVQGNTAAPLDTAAVSQAVHERDAVEADLAGEVNLLQQLITAKRRLLAVQEEKKTLQDILQQARNLPKVPPKK